MFRNVALTGILALGAMLAGCGESSQPTPASTGEGTSAPVAALPGEAKSEAKAPAAPGAKPGSLAEVNRSFARQDTNGDNKISGEEYLAQSKARFNRLDKNKDGALVIAEMPKATNPKGFARMDKDKNGKVTFAEMSAVLERAFIKLDANKDGFVTVDEAPLPKSKK